MIKLAKLFSLFKDNWQIWAGLITVVLIAIGSIQTYRANKWEKESLRLEGKLAEQKADQDLYYGEVAKSRADRRIKEAEEKVKREELETRIREEKAKSEKARVALAEEKLKTVALEPTELVMQINERIGDESSITEAGFFLFTRLGTNRTLDRFKDGEFYLSEYNRQLGIIKDFKTEKASFETSLNACEEERNDNLIGWDDCRETLATSIANNEALKKASKASVWRGRKQGAFWTAILAGGLKLFGVW